MSAVPDRELEEWSADWTAAPDGRDVALDIRRRARAAVLRQAAFTAGEAALVVTALAIVWQQAIREPVTWNVVAMAGLAALALGALAFSVWNRIGTWRPAADSTRAFADLLALRLRRRLRALRAGLYLLAAEAAILVPWVWRVLGERSAPPAPAGYAMWFALLALWLGLFALGCLWLLRRTRRQLARIEAVRRAEDP